jgi:cold shock CspA family protein
VQQYTGTLKFLDHDGRGFGFVRRDDSDVEDFLHISKLHHMNVSAFVPGVTRLRYSLETRTNGKSMAVAIKLAD